MLVVVLAPSLCHSGATVLPRSRPAAAAGGVGCSLQSSVDLPAGGTLRQWESHCHAAGTHRGCGHLPPASPHSPSPSPGILPQSIPTCTVQHYTACCWALFSFFNDTIAQFPSELLWQ